MSAPTFEYCWVTKADGPAGFEKLNHLAAQGWRAVGVARQASPLSMCADVLMERPRVSSEENTQ